MKNRILIALAALPCVALLLTSCSLLDPHKKLTIEYVVNEAWPDGPEVTSNAVETTDETCGDRVDCVEAWSTDEADYLRFTSRQQAADYADALDDGFVSNYIVMDFEGKAASVEDQLLAMQSLDGIWQDGEGPYPDRG